MSHYKYSSQIEFAIEFFNIFTFRSHLPLQFLFLQLGLEDYFTRETVAFVVGL